MSVVITALIFAGLVVQGAIEDPITGLTGLVVPVLGAITYMIFDAKLKKEKNEG